MTVCSPDVAPGLIDPFVRLLEERIGLDAASIGHDEVGRAVRACALSRHGGAIEAADAPQLGAFYRKLTEDPDEWDEFVEHVLVPETWFFREPTAFDALTHVAAERVAAGRRCRVLSVPCATGEEPYSMAIALDQAGLGPDRVTIDAMDISRRALERASEATYGDRAVRYVGEERLARYFHYGRDGHQVNREIQERVTFERGNLVEDGVLARRARYDIVFCRNVLIYFTQAARAQVLGAIDAALLDDGWLVTGHAEVTNVVAPRFVSAKVPRTFAYRKAPLAAPAAPARPALPVAPVVRRPVPKEGARPALEPAARPAGQRGAAAGPGRREPRTLDDVQVLADAGNLQAAADACREYLRVNPGAAQGYYLLGVIESARGDRHSAEEALRRAVYLEPRHVEALRHLSFERGRAGDTREAAQLARRAELARTRQEGSRE